MVNACGAADTYLNVLSTVYAARASYGREECAAPCLHDHRVRPRNRRGCLGPQTVLRFAQECLHQADALMGNARARREP